MGPRWGPRSFSLSSDLMTQSPEISYPGSVATSCRQYWLFLLLGSCDSRSPGSAVFRVVVCSVTSFLLWIEDELFILCLVSIFLMMMRITISRFLMCWPRNQIQLYYNSYSASPCFLISKLLVHVSIIILSPCLLSSCLTIIYSLFYRYLYSFYLYIFTPVLRSVSLAMLIA